MPFKDFVEDVKRVHAQEKKPAPKVYETVVKKPVSREPVFEQKESTPLPSKVGLEKPAPKNFDPNVSWKECKHLRNVNGGEYCSEFMSKCGKHGCARAEK